MPVPRPHRWLPWGWLSGFLTLVAIVLIAGWSEAPPATVTVTLLLLTASVGVVSALLVAQGIRERGRYERALAEAAARDAVLSERLTIARDLHDIVSHGLGAVTVRAAVGARLGRTDPAAAVAALDDVAEISRSATEDLRRLLGVLHDPGAAAPTRPAPSLADVPALLDQARRQGVRVAAEGLDTPVRVPGIALTAYHVVREALANTARHAGPTTARLHLARTAHGVVVTVTDAGPVAGWSAQPGGGHGLALLRGRVAAQGGTLTHGRDGDGYRVVAELPDLADR